MSISRPGVTAQYVSTPGGATIAGGVRTVAFVGPASDTFIFTETRKRPQADTNGKDALSKVVSATSPFGTKLLNIISVSDATHGAYTATTDYIVTTVTGVDYIDWAPGGTEPTSASFDTYYDVTYYVSRGSDFDPHLYFNMNDVISDFGPIVLTPINATTATLTQNSYLTAAAKMAFDAGVPQVILAPTASGGITPTNFQDAFTSLQETVDNVDPRHIVLLLGTVTSSSDFNSIVNSAIAHCDTMALRVNGKPRTLFVSGYVDGSGVFETVPQLVTRATGYANRRVNLIAPCTAVASIQNSTDNTSYDVTVHGTFVAGSIASAGTVRDVSEPFTRKTVTGFKTLGKKYGKAEIDALRNAGVMVLVERGGIIQIHKGETTKVSNANDILPSVVNVVDDVDYDVRNALDVFIGTKLKKDTPGAVMLTIRDILLQEVREDKITDFSNITAKQDPLNPTRIIGGYSILPVYGVENIDLTFGIDLSLIA